MQATSDKEKEKRTETVTIVGVAVWSAAFLLYAHFNREIVDALSIFSLALCGALWLVGVSLAAWAILGLIRSGFVSRSDYIVLAMVAVTTVIMQFGYPTLLRWRLDTRPRYEAHITAIRKLPRYKWDSYCRNNGCQIDPDAPKGVLRVSFIEPGGILDNYTAIIYDPTGDVMKANRFGLNNLHDPKNVTVGMFGGDLVWAEPLGGGWYRCGFT